jgi:hypothetical protein
MLSDQEIWGLAERMRVPLVFCNFKDQLKKKPLQYNKSYVVNLENKYDDEGKRNEGSHYVCFQVNKYANGKVEPIYFDSFGQPQPDTITEFVGGIMPHNDKDVQSLMNSACGWYCLAFLHYINEYQGRTHDLYTDARHFISMFDDLNKSINHIKNEYILKQFFRSADPALRKTIHVSNGEGILNANSIIDDNEKEKKHL